MTVDMHVLKYAAITKALVNKNELSKFHLNVWLLEKVCLGMRLARGRTLQDKFTNHILVARPHTTRAWRLGNETNPM